MKFIIKKSSLLLCETDGNIEREYINGFLKNRCLNKIVAITHRFFYPCKGKGTEISGLLQDFLTRQALKNTSSAMERITQRRLHYTAKITQIFYF